MPNISFNFDGKVVLITGSSSGIGAGAALLFAENGAHIVITSNIKEQLSEVAEKCRQISNNNTKILQVLADVTKEEDLKRLVETTITEFGRIDVLVNNVGILSSRSINDPDYMNVFKSVMQINLYSTVYLTHLCVDYLGKTKGNIINISSIAGLQSVSSMSGITKGKQLGSDIIYIGDGDQFCAYSVSKCALLMFTKCMAAELGPKGIRVNSISPSTIRTSIFEKSGLSKEETDEFFEKIGSKYPIGRVGNIEDIANAMLFLASEESSFITGSNLLVDGGHIAANIPVKTE